MGSDESPEQRLIGRYFRPLARHPGALGLRDDAAFFTPPAGCDLVLTTDAVMAGVHYVADEPADVVARKALRVNLSDLAAKGADPAGFLLSIALPGDVSEDWLAAFTAGLEADAEAYGCPLFGGDTDRTPGATTVTIAAFGTLPRGSMVHRSGAKPGDRVFVTGTIGDAALGLALRQGTVTAAGWGLGGEGAAHLIERYRLPQPRNAVAAAVRRFATAAMDVSDGLAGDLGKLCAASGVGAEISVERVPLSAAAAAVLAADPAQLNPVLTGGDDYEILATIPPGHAGAFTAACEQAGVPVTEIGRIVAAPPEARFLAPDGSALSFERSAFSHF